MREICNFIRRSRWLAAAVLLISSAQIAIFAVTLARHQSDFLEKPGYLAQDVTKLGGPCMAVKQLEYDKHGPLGIGDCEVHYTNTTETAATVTLQIIRNNRWVIVTADAVTDGGPLPSLNWRVTRSVESLQYDPEAT